MDYPPLLGVALQDVAFDPWSWRSFTGAVLLGLEWYWLRLAVPSLGLIAGITFRRRHGTVARRVLLGCAGLLLVELYRVLGIWIWVGVMPEPRGLPPPVYREVLNRVLYALATLVRLGSLWLLVSAVLYGRVRRPEEVSDDPR